MSHHSEDESLADAELEFDPLAATCLGDLIYNTARTALKTEAR